MPRPIWDGHITFGLVSIPVKLLSAEESSARLSFHQYDRRTMDAVHLKRVNASDEEIPWEEIVKGYETDDGRVVLLEAEDFERANVEASRTIEILQTACADEIEPALFAKPYYLAPAGPGGLKPYALLRETLRRQKRAAVARVVIRTREHLALIYPSGDALVLGMLRFAYELRDAADLDLPGDIVDLGVSDKEIELAEQLVKELSAPWDPTAYTDSYRDDLLGLIEAKLEAGDAYDPEPLPARGEPGEVVDLMAALKASLRQDAETG